MPLEYQLRTLYRTWLHADALRTNIWEVIEREHVPLWRTRFLTPIPEDNLQDVHLSAARVVKGDDWGLNERKHSYLNQFVFRQWIFFALEYVVIEGYLELQELGFEVQYRGLDELLEISEHVRSLKDYRDATLHVQEMIPNARQLNFHADEKQVQWIHSVHQRFEQFFVDVFHADKPFTIFYEKSLTEETRWVARFYEITPALKGVGATREDARERAVTELGLWFGRKIEPSRVIDSE